MSPWRLVLTVLLLLAVPLKGLAAVGVAACAPGPMAHTEAAPPAPAHADDAPCAHHDRDTAPTQAHAMADGHDDGAPDDHGPCHHSAPCCVSLALAAVPQWQLGELPRHGAPASPVIRPGSVTPPMLERPPRA